MRSVPRILRRNRNGASVQRNAFTPGENLHPPQSIPLQEIFVQFIITLGSGSAFPEGTVTEFPFVDRDETAGIHEYALSERDYHWRTGEKSLHVPAELFSSFQEKRRLQSDPVFDPDQNQPCNGTSALHGNADRRHCRKMRIPGQPFAGYMKKHCLKTVLLFPHRI